MTTKPSRRKQNKSKTAKQQGGQSKKARVEIEDLDETEKKEVKGSKKSERKGHTIPSSSDSDDSPDEHSDSDQDDEEDSVQRVDDDDDDDDDDEVASPKKFSDENASWLKPKKAALLSSDDEEDSKDKEDDDDEEEEDEEELLEIEKQSRLLDKEMLMEKQEAEEEMRRTVAEHTAVYHLPTQEELESNLSGDIDRVVPPSEIRSHIESILEVLADFKSRREPGRTRSEYIDRLSTFLAELHGYLPELVDYFLTMFSPPEAVEFIDASDKPRPLVIRTNTIKSRRKDLAASLMKRGVTLDPLASWSKVGLKIVESPVPIGATPEYLSGMYMLQSASSMCPVLALDPQPQERVLDMSAAPGGKTSYMAQLMRNTGSIMANDLKADRQKATVANMHRLGVKNTMTCTHDGRKLGQIFHNRFDRILLDAPCSGLGVISRDPSVKVQRTIADVKKCAHLQKELLIAAIDALSSKSKTGGFMVYSTCSVAVAENEEVVNYALMKRDIKIVDSGLPFGKPGFVRYQEKRFHPSLELTRRFYPHVHNMDGFYVCKIQKLSDARPEDTLDIVEDEEEEGENVVEMEKSETKAVDKKSEKGKKRKEVEETKLTSSKKKTKETPKRQKLSIPPANTKPISKKTKPRRLNAKVTKPRRKKAATDA